MTDYLCEVIALFKTNQVGAFVFLAILVALTRLPVLWGMGVDTAPNVTNAGWAYDFIARWTYGHALATYIASCLLVFSQALIVNWLINQTRITGERTWLPSMMYVVMAAMIPDFQHLGPQLISVVFLLFSLRRVFQTSRSHDATGIIFDAGFWIAAGALFYPPLIWLGLPVYAGVNSLRALIERTGRFCLRHDASGGFGTTVHFLQGRGKEFIDKHVWSLFQYNRLEVEHSILFWSKAGLLVLVLAVILLSFGVYYHKKSNQVQKFLNILLWVITATILSSLLRRDLVFEHALTAVPATAIFWGMNFQHIRNKLVAETLFWAFMGLIAAVYFLNLNTLSSI